MNLAGEFAIGGYDISCQPEPSLCGLSSNAYQSSSLF